MAVSWRAATAFGLGIVCSAPAGAGPITFNTALPVHSGELIVRGQAIWLRATDDRGPADKNLAVVALPTVVAYGANARVTLFGTLPLLDKSLEATTPSGRGDGRRSPRGDASSRASVRCQDPDRGR